MSPRRALIAFALLAVVFVAGLVVSGARRTNTDAFSNTQPLLVYSVKLEPRQSACQTPIAVPTSFDRVDVWLDHAGAATLQLTVANAQSGRLLATGTRSIDLTAREQRVALNATVPAGIQGRVCVTNQGPFAVALFGAGKSGVSGTLTSGGSQLPNATAFLFERSPAHSQLSLLPTALRRAALFKPGWVGEWTFWVLVVALLAAFGVLAAALRSATRDDRR
jgi:hypothetical protein